MTRGFIFASISGTGGEEMYEYRLYQNLDGDVRDFLIYELITHNWEDHLVETQLEVMKDAPMSLEDKINFLESHLGREVWVTIGTSPRVMKVVEVSRDKKTLTHYAQEFGRNCTMEVTHIDALTEL